MKRRSFLALLGALVAAPVAALASKPKKYAAHFVFQGADWGESPALRQYRLQRQLEVYRKIDERIALDYMVPFRPLRPKLRHTVNLR